MFLIERHRLLQPNRKDGSSEVPGESLSVRWRHRSFTGIVASELFQRMRSRACHMEALLHPRLSMKVSWVCLVTTGPFNFS